jgi:hypothetical protein
VRTRFATTFELLWTSVVAAGLAFLLGRVFSRAHSCFDTALHKAKSGFAKPRFELENRV